MEKRTFTNLIKGILFLCVGLLTQQSFAQTFSYGGGAVAIPDNGCAAANNANASVVVAGVAGGNVLRNITIGSITHTWNNDLRISIVAPDATVIALSTNQGAGFGSTGFSNAIFTATAGSSAPSIVGNTQTSVSGTFSPQGNLASVNTQTNGTWTLRVCDAFGQDVGNIVSWSLFFGPPPAAFAAAPANVTIQADAATCASPANSTITAPVVNNAASATSLTYSVSTVPGSFNFTSGGTVTLPALNAGTYTVTYTIVQPNEANAVTTQTVVVSAGNTPPVFTSCPASVTVNLAPGACDAVVTYPAPCVSDCAGFVSAFGTASNATQTWSQSGQRGAFFDITNNSGQAIRLKSVNPMTFTPGNPTTNLLTVYMTNANTSYVGNQAIPGNWSVRGSATVTLSPGIAGGPAAIPLTAPVVLPAGATIGVYVVGTTGFGGGPVAYQSSAGIPAATLNSFTDGTITVRGGIGSSGLFAGFFGAAGSATNFRAFFGSVEWDAASQSVCYGDVPETGLSSLGQTAGLPSGSAFPRGTTTNIYKVTDSDGNMAFCQFSVTVNEYPTPTHTMVCNDLVQISLDEDCVLQINADQILEGGPYGCYDDYLVEIDRIAPYGNGPWVPAILTSADIGKTYGVRVTDDGSANSCWGTFTVEDKLKPELVCLPIEIPCNAPADPVSMSGGAVTSTLQFSSGNFAITGSGGSFTFDVANSGDIEDLNLLFTTDHSWPGDIAVEIQSPEGTIVELFNQPGVPASTFGCAQPGLNVTFDDAATLTATDFENACIPNNSGTYQAIDLLSAFNGENPNGTWTINVFDAFAAGDNGPNSSITLSIVQSGPIEGAFPNDLGLGDLISVNVPGRTFVVAAGAGDPQLDNCSNVTLTYIDSETEATCEGEYSSVITRKWTATDASGNTTTCEQTISRIRPTLQDVVRAPDYDGVDNDAFTCDQVASMPIVDGKHIPTPEWIELQGKQGFPYVFGLPAGCNINWDYDDLVIAVCDGTYKIRRKWTIIDWCTGVDFEYNQLIKVVDEDGPVLPDVNPNVVGNQLANITVSTDPSACCATVNLPDIIVSDACSRINNVSAMIVTFDQYTGEQSAMYQFAGTLPASGFPGNNLWNPDTLAVFGNTPCLPLSPNPGVTNSGGHLVTYTVEDACGNTSTGTFRIVVRDFTVPEVACVEFTVVSVGADDPYDCYTGYEPDYSYPAGQPAGTPVAGSCQGGGVTWVKATSFDNGSYDNCGNLRFTVRRDLTNTSACINNLNPSNGSIPCDNPFGSFPTEYERATGTGTMSAVDNIGNFLTGADSLKFYCCEVNGDPITVILAVYQVDADGNVQFGPDGQAIRNECMVQVSVQDKVKPICQSPAFVTVACENFDPSLWAYGQAIPSDNCCLDTTKNYQGQCGLTHSVSYASFDTVCNRGTIVRTFRAFDCHGLSSQCTQRIVVTYGQYYFVKFPDDKTVGNCTPGGDYGKPTFYGEDCELLATSYVDEVFTVNDGACFKIERTWTVINWCSYNQNQPCIFVPNPNPLGPQANQQQFTGPTVSAPNNGIPGWTASNFLLDPLPNGQQWNYGTQSWAANANCYKYKQIIKVYDNNAPVVTADPYTCDPLKATTNDPQLWNSMFWYDASISSHDLCEEPTDLTLSATDLCAGANLNVSYLLFLDLDNSGDMETVVNSLNPLASGQLNPGEVLFGNAGSPNFLTGQPQRFDFRKVPGSNPPVDLSVPERWVFSVYTSTSGANRTAKVVFRRGNQAAADANSPTVQLPHGTHKIKWIVEDGCGNQTVKEVTFTVGDCKKPTVVCYNGLSVNIMQTGMVTLWASDFLQYGDDNCTPAGQLKYGIRKSGTGTGFPTETSVTFDCTELGTQFVELWAQDKANNADFCETYILVQDNMGSCGTNATIAGALKTEATQGVENATVEVDGSANGAPVFSQVFSDLTGDYAFSNALPIGGDYTVTPGLDLDPTNGVTTYDLVLINRHILGLEPLSTPYKMIAADANMSNTITTFDIVEIRKLILGIYNELPSNTSWRFVDQTQVFSNAQNPFADVIRENRSFSQIAGSNNGDFVGVKIGDVNGTASPNATAAPDDRTSGTLYFDIEDRNVVAGEEVTVNFKAAEKQLGYQFTMNLNGLVATAIEPGANMSEENFAVFADANAITTSVNGGAGEFAIKFRASQSGSLSQMLGVSSRITKAEAYNESSEKQEVAFRFNRDGVSTVAGVGFELYQNVPNPFVSKTYVGFNLPEATEATLTVYDETGRTIYTTKGQFAKGRNAIALDRSVLAGGVLYYKLETAANSATKKMIQTK